MTPKEINELVDHATIVKQHIRHTKVLRPKKWVLGISLVEKLLLSTFEGNTIDEESFLGMPYIIDYKDKDVMYVAIETGK